MTIEEFNKIYGAGAIKDGRVIDHDSFYVEYTNGALFVDGFELPEGITAFGERFALNIRRLPDNFVVPEGIKDLRDFGCNLEVSPVNISLPSTLIMLGYFCRNVNLITTPLVIPEGVVKLEIFGLNLRDIDSNIKLPDSVKHLGYFGKWARNITVDFKWPRSVVNLRNFFSNRSLLCKYFLTPLHLNHNYYQRQ